jgi:hypothetical protein
MDLSRIWTLVNELLLPGEKGHCHTVVGNVVRPEWTVRDLQAAVGSDARDVVVFAKARVLVVLPKPTQKLKLRAAFQAARGNLSGFATTHEYPRLSVTAINGRADGPPNLPLLEALRWMTVSFVDGAHIHMLVDESSNPQPRLDERAAGYLRGADP